jgi:hypothetical protein
MQPDYRWGQCCVGVVGQIHCMQKSFPMAGLTSRCLGCNLRFSPSPKPGEARGCLLRLVSHSRSISSHIVQAGGRVKMASIKDPQTRALDRRLVPEKEHPCPTPLPTSKAINLRRHRSADPRVTFLDPHLFHRGGNHHTAWRIHWLSYIPPITLSERGGDVVALNRLRRRAFVVSETSIRHTTFNLRITTESGISISIATPAGGGGLAKTYPHPATAWQHLAAPECWRRWWARTVRTAMKSPNRESARKNSSRKDCGFRSF